MCYLTVVAWVVSAMAVLCDSILLMYYRFHFYEIGGLVATVEDAMIWKYILP